MRSRIVWVLKKGEGRRKKEEGRHERVQGSAVSSEGISSHRFEQILRHEISHSQTSWQGIINRSLPDVNATVDPADGIVLTLPGVNALLIL